MADAEPSSTQRDFVVTYNNPRSAIQEYAQAGAQLADIEPHKTVQMLLQGAMDRIAIAKGHMQRKEIRQKGDFISKAISIIDGLQASLDYESGGAIAGNLDGLYEYMQRQLLKANLENNQTILDEVFGLLANIKEAWDAIPEDAKRVPPR
jgi:flagellar protein FliS